MWRMVKDKNAIEVLAVQVRFSEQMNNVLTRRVKDDIESAARKAGFVEQFPLHGFRINLANPGDVVQISGSSMSFQKSSLEHDFRGTVQKTLKGKVDVTPTDLLFQTFEYDNWTNTRETVLSVLLSGMRRAMQGAALGAVRFEYLDRFIFEGEDPASAPKGLLNASSKWLAPHIFNDASLWHSHTGLIENAGPDRRTLIGVNADLQEVAGDVDNPNFGKRSIQLVTFAEYQFFDLGGELPSEEVESRLTTYLDELYSIARTAFAGVIDVEFAKMNGLPPCET